jgi:DNA-binding transcriptional LysR family regulator
MAFDNIETIKRAVELGEGLAILPEPTVRREVDAGALAAVPLSSPRLVRPLGIIHRKGNVYAQAVRCFIDVVQENGQVESEDKLVGSQDAGQSRSRKATG